MTLRAAAWALMVVTVVSAESLIPVNETAFQNLLKSHRGQVVLVNFWATWCAPCREEMPTLAGLQSKFAKKGFQLITVSADEVEQEKEAYGFLKQSGVAMPAYLKRATNDEQFINSIDPKWSGALPASFLFDKQGRKVKSLIGEADTIALEAAIRKLVRD